MHVCLHVYVCMCVCVYVCICVLVFTCLLLCWRQVVRRRAGDKVRSWRGPELAAVIQRVDLLGGQSRVRSTPLGFENLDVLV